MWRRSSCGRNARAAFALAPLLHSPRRVTGETRRNREGARHEPTVARLGRSTVLSTEC